MKAEELYARLDRDFGVKDLTDDWSFMSFNHYIAPGFKERYMGIMLEAGTHEISFVYETPGIKYGVILSLLALGAVASTGVFRMIKKNKKNKELNEIN